MHKSVKCPEGHTVEVSEESFGKLMQCPVCQATMLIPLEPQSETNGAEAGVAETDVENDGPTYSLNLGAQADPVDDDDGRVVPREHEAEPASRVRKRVRRKKETSSPGNRPGSSNRPSAPSEKQSNPIRTWIVLFLVGWGVVSIVIGGFVVAWRAGQGLPIVGPPWIQIPPPEENPTGIAGETLAQARQRLQTKLASQGPAPQGYDREDKSAIAKRVSFYSDDRLLWGWYSAPAGPGPHPAVLYGHGGFALDSSDFKNASLFLNSGYAVFCPAWRGENGNNGIFEFLGAEVTDVVNAMEFLAARPEIDGNNVFIAGHSMGATLALLAAEISDRPRGVGACGAMPDIQQSLAEMAAEGQEPPEDIVFDWKNPLAGTVRSPIRFVKDLKCPVAMYYGDEESFQIAQAKVMASHAEKFDRQVTVETIKNTDHFTALTPALPRVLKFFDQLRKQPRQTPVKPSAYPTPTMESLNSVVSESLNESGFHAWGPGFAEKVSLDWNLKSDPGRPPADFTAASQSPFLASRNPVLKHNPRWNMLGQSIVNLETMEVRYLDGKIPNLTNAERGRPMFADLGPHGSHFAYRWIDGSNRPLAVTIHDTKDASLVQYIVHASTARISAAGSAIVEKRGKLHTVELKKGAELSPPISAGDAWALSPGGRWLAILSKPDIKRDEVEDEATLVVYDSISGEKRAESIHRNIAVGRYLHFSNDGKEIVSGSKSGLTIWDFESGKVAVSHPFTTDRAQVSLVRNGKFLFQNMRLYQRKTGRLVAAINHAPIPAATVSQAIVEDDWVWIPPYYNNRDPQAGPEGWTGLIGKYPIEKFEPALLSIEDDPQQDYLNSLKLVTNVKGVNEPDAGQIRQLLKSCVTSRFQVQTGDGPDAVTLTIDYAEEQGPTTHAYRHNKCLVSGVEFEFGRENRFLGATSFPFDGESTKCTISLTLTTPDGRQVWHKTETAVGDPRQLEMTELVRQRIRADGIGAAFAVMDPMPTAIPRNPKFEMIPVTSTMACNLTSRLNGPVPELKEKVPMTTDWSLAWDSIPYEPVQSRYDIGDPEPDGPRSLVISDDENTRFSVLTASGQFYSQTLTGDARPEPVRSRIETDELHTDSRMIGLPNSEFVAVLVSKGVLLAKPSAGLKDGHTVPFDKTPGDISVSGDGKKLFVLLGKFDEASKLQVFDLPALLASRKPARIKPVLELENLTDPAETDEDRPWLLVPAQPDPTRIFVIDHRGVSGLDLTSGDLQLILPPDQYKTCRDKYRFLTTSADGTRIYWGRDGRLWLYDGLTGDVILNPRKQHSGMVVMSPDDRHVAVGASRRQVGVYHADELYEELDVTITSEVFGPVTGSVAWSGDGRFLAVAAPDGAVTVWDFKKPDNYRR